MHYRLYYGFDLKASCALFTYLKENLKGKSFKSFNQQYEPLNFYKSEKNLLMQETT